MRSTSPEVRFLRKEVSRAIRDTAHVAESLAYWRARCKCSELELEAAHADAEKQRQECDATHFAKVDTINGLKIKLAELEIDRARLLLEINRLARQPNELLAGAAVELNAILVEWPRRGDADSKKRIAEIRDLCEKRGNGEPA